MKNQRNSIATIIIIIVAVLGALVVLTWGNYRFAKQNPGGNDFLVHWMGTRSLITQGLNPYSDEVALKIQNFAYGHAAAPGQHELRVAYPLYSVVLFLPFSLVSNFNLARAMWMTVLEIGLVGLTLISMRLARWRVGPLMLAWVLLFSILWYHGLRPLINGNAVILVAFLLAAGFLALRAGADELAGVLFAFSTIKPQVVVLVLAFVVFWAINRRRWRVVGWLVGTVILLAASAALIIPTWIVDNLREVIRYPSYNPPGTPRAAFISWWPSWGSRVGWALTALMAVLLLTEWWANRRASFNGFLWTVCLTLAAGQWIGIQTDPGNFVVLVPALFLVFSLLADRWKTGGKVFVITSMIALLVGIWALFLATLQRADQPVQSPIMFFPLPAFLLLTLFWVRWWAVAPPTVWYDQLEGR
ncbi:MAG TPA: glycosyltransferase family 87 protein [Anaerolineaceae bacterium]